MSTSKSISSRTLAQAALLSAVALVFLLIAGVIPAGWAGVTAIAGLSVAVAISASGILTGFLCYLVTSILSFLLLPGKHVAVLFAGLFGLYPLVKIRIEKLKSKLVSILVKLLFFNLSFGILGYFASHILWGDLFAQWTGPVPLLTVLLIGGSVIFLLYDFAFTKVMSLLQARLIPQIRRMFQSR